MITEAMDNESINRSMNRCVAIENWCYARMDGHRTIDAREPSAAWNGRRWDRIRSRGKLQLRSAFLSDGVSRETYGILGKKNENADFNPDHFDRDCSVLLAGLNGPLLTSWSFMGFFVSQPAIVTAIALWSARKR
jgi:hypothetical protein